MDSDQVKPYVDPVYLTKYRHEKTGEDMKYVAGKAILQGPRDRD